MSVKGNVWFQKSLPDLFDQQHNPASVDLELDNQIILVDFQGYNALSSIMKQSENVNPYQQMFVDAAEFDPKIRHTNLDLAQFPKGIWIRPGVGILASTSSILKMPENAVGQILLKSSRGREFYQSCMAGFIDNGFEGQVTLELYAPIIPIFLQVGLKVVQLRCDEVQEFDFTYVDQPTAKYQNQSGPTPSKENV